MPEHDLAARRSCLSVPGVAERMLAGARELAPDEVVIDLEDSVPPPAKEATRAAVVAAVRDGDWRADSIAVRINGPGTEWFERDVRELLAGAGERLRCLVVPKVECVKDVEVVALLADQIEAAHPRARPIGLELLIETARGLRNAPKIAEADQRVESLIVGYADLAASLGRPPIAPGEDPRERWAPVLHDVLIAARAAGIQAIDGPFFDIADVDGCRAWADHAHSLGYDGKWALHPTQIVPLGEAFAPSDAELDAAAALLEALAASEAGGRGAALHDGEMIDEASRKQALGVLARGAAAGRPADERRGA